MKVKAPVENAVAAVAARYSPSVTKNNFFRPSRSVR